MLILFSYALALIGFAIYSFALIDPNITFVQHQAWVAFRDYMVQIGYHQRYNSWILYLICVSLIVFFHWIFVKNYKQWNPLKLALLIGGILLFSYPFLTHDMFNYLFDAKIFTFYHENPYLKKALDFQQDEWVRFMHWTHRTYPYGPVFLVLTFIPSFLSMGKFTLDFLLFKVLFTTFYLLGVYFLQKMNKKWAIIFATHPLVIVEGLIASHNDLLHTSFIIIGIYLLFQNKQILSRVMFLLSFGIKFMTPSSFIITSNKKYKILNVFAFLGQMAIIAYLAYTSEIQQWYFLGLLAFIPFFERFITRCSIFFVSLLLSYYPYIYLGGWDDKIEVVLKHQILWAGFILNIIYLFITYGRDYQKGNFSLRELWSEKEHTSKQT